MQLLCASMVRPDLPTAANHSGKYYKDYSRLQRRDRSPAQEAYRQTIPDRFFSAELLLQLVAHVCDFLRPFQCGAADPEGIFCA